MHARDGIDRRILLLLLLLLLLMVMRRVGVMRLVTRMGVVRMMTEVAIVLIRVGGVCGFMLLRVRLRVRRRRGMRM